MYRGKKQSQPTLVCFVVAPRAVKRCVEEASRGQLL